MSILPATRKPAGQGCLTGCLLRIVGTLVVGSLVALGMFAIFAPWAFHLGGSYHPFAYWGGWGTIHAAEGDYVVYLWIGPWRGGRSTFPSLSGPSLRGSGAICSPHGEIYDGLQVRGGFINHNIRVDTDGEPVRLSLAQRLNFLGTNGPTRLNLEFRGNWHNPDLDLNDEGNLRRMFNADGTFYTGDPHKRPSKGAPLELTLHEGSRSEFLNGCAAVKKK